MTPDGEIYKAHIVERMGDTVCNFATADGAVEVTGDLAQFKKDKIVKVKLLKSERDIQGRYKNI